jgi:AraC family transcriptional regulator of adaptative response/methylated-DNA-[protein]-cysteine methyltransferase
MSPKCDLVQTVCQFIESHRGQPVSLQMLADWAGVSRFHLQRTFKDATGLSPREYAQAARLSNFKAGVRTGMTLAEARIESGLSDTRQLGMAPKIYKRQGFGETIRFAIGTCRFGMIAVASTAQGICSVQFGNSADELWEAIKGEFVNAKVIEDEESVSTQLQSVIDLAEGKLRTLDLPRDIRATAFQQLVWNYLIDIPRGETRTYQEVANGIERPASVRAVANACGANPVALVVPCHRVVRSDGSQGGYRWGTEVKSAILRHERDRQ